MRRWLRRMSWAVRVRWWAVCRWWYWVRYGVTIDLDGSMFPSLGRGRYVSVLRNGPYLEVTAHVKYPGLPIGMIRIIPYQPNHGIMVEFVDEYGSVRGRGVCDYRALLGLATGLSEGKQDGTDVG